MLFSLPGAAIVVVSLLTLAIVGRKSVKSGHVNKKVSSLADAFSTVLLTIGILGLAAVLYAIWIYVHWRA